ncbi:MAG: BglII/BstYI family type II restriction endonuclease [Gammaproteobacteria bacterium]|nr:BglII/BstYI family type II restriction endonuclease [Gammaproteobacteria bacterium]
MRIAAKYSHMNGEEYLIVHQPELWQEVRDVVASVDAEACRTKLSRERGRRGGQMLYSPIEMNKAFEDGFGQREWHEESRTFWVTSDERVLRGITGESPERQKAAIEEAGYTPIRTYNQTDFVKDRVAVEVQFGKYAFVAHDLFVKHLSFFVSDVIDVGIEILPVKELEASMSSGVPYYERDLLNVLRQGRGVPAVPLILVGIAP